MTRIIGVTNDYVGGINSAVPLLLPPISFNPLGINVTTPDFYFPPGVYFLNIEVRVTSYATQTFRVRLVQGVNTIITSNFPSLAINESTIVQLQDMIVSSDGTLPYRIEFLGSGVAIPAFAVVPAIFILNV